MEMRDAVLETPWPEEPTPCVQMKTGPLLRPETPPSPCATYLIQQETLKWAQSMTQKHPDQIYPLP